MARKAEGSGVIEQGNIYFLYRPKVEQEHPKGKRDVERFYIVLSPEGKRVYREIIIGRKELPKTAKGERNWGFVNMVASDARKLEKDFGEVEYETKTRGERKLEPVRPAGEGVYAIVRHDDHTHLAYSLELPKTPQKVQHEFRIEEEASYIISVKNPEKGSPPQAGLGGSQKATFPKKLMEVFRDRRFADADPPDFLDYEGAEIILIGTGEDPSEIGLKLNAERETEATADIFRNLKLNRQKHPVKPLFEGKEMV